MTPLQVSPLRAPSRAWRHAAAILLLATITRAQTPVATVAAVTSEIESRFRRDDSLAAWGVRDSALIASSEAALRGWSTRLAAIAPASLPDAAARSRLAALRGFLDAANATTICRFDLWNVDQLFGLQVQLAQSVASATLGSDAAQERLLRGAARFPTAVRWQIADLRAGVAAGFTAPRANVERVVEQLDNMLAEHAAALDAPLSRDSSAAFATAWRAIVRDSLVPALTRYRDYLAPGYVATARVEPGLTALPNGPACYAAIVYQATTIRLDLDSLAAVAVRHRIETLAEIQELGRRIFGGGMTTADILKKARTDPQFMMRDPDSILAAYRRTVERARALLPLQFALVPDAPLVIRATPKEQAAAAAPARYLQAPSDGTEPAVFVVNAYQPGGIPVMNIELGTAHEAYPGHHFQFVYAAQRRASGGAPDFLSNGAYLEGWGIYAEQLADEAGLYDKEITRLGYLLHRLDVYMALQIDIGIHAFGWSRQQAIDTMRVVAGRPIAQAASYADRHAASPGQLATYGVGYLTITGARERAETKMGKKFDLKGFHAVVLGDPGATLPELERSVADWSAIP